MAQKKDEATPNDAVGQAANEPTMGEFHNRSFEELQRGTERRFARKRRKVKFDHAAPKRRRVLRDVDIFDYDKLAKNDAIRSRVDALVANVSIPASSVAQSLRCNVTETPFDAESLEWYNRVFKKGNLSAASDDKLVQILVNDGLKKGTQRSELGELEYAALLQDHRQRKTMALGQDSTDCDGDDDNDIRPGKVILIGGVAIRCSALVCKR